MDPVLITLLSGCAFFIGYLMTIFIKNEKGMLKFAIGFSFSIIFGLIALDIIPECIEFEDKWVIPVGIGIGLIVLKLLDHFIPEHEHSEEKPVHMEHIGLMSALALFLHNAIEGTAVYTTALSDIKTGAFMALAVAFHNIPLGIQITSLVHNRKWRFVIIVLLALSSVVGVGIINLFNIELTEMWEAILLSVTLGMLLYLLIFELAHEVKEHIKNKEVIIGLILGLVLIGAGHLMHLA